jgi:hypothetical protein
VTNDIVPTAHADGQPRSSVRHGCALRQLANPNEIIEVPGG